MIDAIRVIASGTADYAQTSTPAGRDSRSFKRTQVPFCRAKPVTIPSFQKKKRVIFD